MRIETTARIGIATVLAVAAGLHAAEAPGSKAGVGAAAVAPRVPAGFRLAANSREEPYTKTGWAQEIVHEQSGISMVYVPAGSFLMGSPPTETNRNPDEIQHEVVLTRGFYLGKYEVTQQEWQSLMGSTVRQQWEKSGKSDPLLGTGKDMPMYYVSWNDARDLCAKLGAGFRLPTEAEWEYACRGGSNESLYFWWGNELEAGEGRLNISAMDLLPNRTKAWPLAKAPWSDGFSFVSPVDHYGEKGRNGFGMADMCGGVWEFVIDHFDPTGGHEEIYYEDPAKLSVSRPVCRGGNYFDVPGNARCAVRLGIRDIHYSDSRDGFRICLGRRVPDKPAK